MLCCEVIFLKAFFHWATFTGPKQIPDALDEILTGLIEVKWARFEVKWARVEVTVAPEIEVLEVLEVLA